MMMERIVKGIWIPIDIWQDGQMSWNEKVLLMEIDSFTSKGLDCYFSNEYIAEMLGVSIASAKRVLAALIDRGLVRVTRFDGRSRYVETTLCVSMGEPAGSSRMSRQTAQKRSGRQLKNELADSSEVSRQTDQGWAGRVLKIEPQNKQYNKQANKQLNKEEKHKESYFSLMDKNLHDGSSRSPRGGQMRDSYMEAYEQLHRKYGDGQTTDPDEQ